MGPMGPRGPWGAQGPWGPPEDSPRAQGPGSPLPRPPRSGAGAEAPPWTHWAPLGTYQFCKLLAAPRTLAPRTDGALGPGPGRALGTGRALGRGPGPGTGALWFPRWPQEPARGPGPGFGLALGLVLGTGSTPRGGVGTSTFIFPPEVATRKGAQMKKVNVFFSSDRVFHRCLVYLCMQGLVKFNPCGGVGTSTFTPPV